MRNRSRIFVSILAIIFSASFFSGCVTIYNPATERKETLLFDTQSEVSLGQNMDAQLKKELKMHNDPVMQSRLEKIGKRISMYSDRQDLYYHFKVVKDKDLNAFAIPGGFVYVNSGLMEAANDDELAGVLAHEIGHIAARHSVKKLQTVLGYQLLIGIVLGGNQDTVSQAINVVFDLVNLGYSRKDEFLADKLAVRYTRRSGYNPKGIVTFFEKLKKDADLKGRGSGHIAFLSSHPSTEDRIAQVEQEIKLNPY